MRIPQLKCKCNEIVLKSLDGEDSKIRSKVLVIKGDEVFAICKGCSSEVRVPLKLDEEFINPPLFIKN